MESDGIAIFLVGDTKIFIHQMYAPGPDDLPPENHIALTTPDIDVTCEELTDRGLVLLVPPRLYYWGRAAYLRDPDGHLIELIQEDG